MRTLLRTLVALSLALAQPAYGWWDGGHMVIAYIAYKNLTPKTRSDVDTLLKHNPMYKTWTKGVPQSEKGLVAFVHAATWADCIKQKTCAPGYTSDGGDTPPGNPSDSQNIGYSDKLMHKYWHFVDEPISAGADGLPPKTPNALTEIVLLSAAIQKKEPRGVESYDLAWLEHLVGDVHQPLHCTSRFTVNNPKGDAGGNFVKFSSKGGDELHAYWDGLLGDKPTMADVSKLGDELLAAPRPAGADDITPSDWVDGSFGLAKSSVYVAPISDDNNPAVPFSPRPDATYSANALAVARSQATLAGYRLAALLNADLR